ncbi:MAG: glycoside hydrolase family 1 protein [Candidatus Omnitrophica bacterium]|nr:glycoside hydrolase family 1 protein [Candidatus Omnitrophota bacterium]
MSLRFPKGFLWGTATSAHQVEGGNNLNDWWDWEQAGHVAGHQVSGIACDQFHRFAEDFALSESLHLNAHRLSIEWSRIEPEENVFSEPATYHYRRVLESLHEHKQTPMVTLLHFTLPRWVARQGGWENPKILIWFERYARKCAEAFGDLVPFWNTLNEPMVYFFESFVMGNWPPGKQDWIRHIHVVKHQIQAHAKAYEAIHLEERKHSWNTQVGLAVYFRVIQPVNPHSWMDKLGACLRDYVFNQLFVNAIATGVIGFPAAWNEEIPGLKGAWDFIGLNYYSRDEVKANVTRWKMMCSEPLRKTSCECNDLGWEVYPEGIYLALKSLARFAKPIYITENGICSGKDAQRERFLIEHLRYVHKAIMEKADVRGYFYWSLIDNFEWAHGYGPQFGLVEVDYATQKRSLRPSARLYGEIASANALSV